MSNCFFYLFRCGQLIFLTPQVLTSAGFEDSIPSPFFLRLIYFAMIFTGLVVFAILVGFITESVTTFMTSLAEGKTRVLETGHTLILGFNEATVRAVIQISFLRRQYQKLNEERYPFLYYIPMLRNPMMLLGLLERPSSPVAAADICVVSARKSKEEMHLLLSTAMKERGIIPWRTKLGQNVICRVGDPNNVNDLIRVGAHRAGAILTMMTERDIEEYEDSNGGISNGATMRTALALRHVLFTNPFNAANNFLVNPDLRIVLQLTNPSVYVDAACFKGAPLRNENGQIALFKGRPVSLEVIHPLDITVFLNSLMFNCAAQPGLAKVIMNIFDFEGNAIRRRKVMNLRYGKDGKYGAAVGKTFEEVQRDYPIAIFIALIDPLITDVEEMKRKGYGLCPNPKILLKQTDMVIFIGPKSTPMRKSGHSELVQNYRDNALQLMDGVINLRTKVAKTKSNCLICGWRPLWGEFPKRLKKRIEEICVLREPGSFLIFLNGLSFEEFAEVMKNMEAVPLTEEETNKFKQTSYTRRLYKMESYGIFISHIVGDASKPSTMAPIIQERTIHTAIVLGTQAKQRLSSHSQDTRVMSIMLLLRKLWIAKNEGVPMHVVSENQEDMSAKLALSPPVSVDSNGVLDDDMHDPDFINTQAIYARVLVQTLAYPVIKPAIADLFDDSPGSADLMIAHAAAYVPLGTEMTFGVIQELVLLHQGERSICIGIICATGEVLILPEHEKVFKFEDKDRLINITRKHLEIKNWTAQEDAYGTASDKIETENFQILNTRSLSGPQIYKQDKQVHPEE